jgi:hypothetical protein
MHPWLGFSFSADGNDFLQEPSSPMALSGIYEVRHQNGRATLAVFLRGQQFPTCPCCAEAVRYRLDYSAPYIFDDEDFAT